MKKKTKTVGRPSRYSRAILEVTRELASKGNTIEQIAQVIGVDERTIWKWSEKYNEFRQALKDGRAEAVEAVENALFRSAIGYEITETKKIKCENGKSRVEIITKQVPPNVSACIFFLKNRDPENWKDRREVEAVVAEKQKIIFDAIDGAE